MPNILYNYFKISRLHFERILRNINATAYPENKTFFFGDNRYIYVPIL